MKQRTLLFILVLLSTLTASGIEAKIDGIFYILDTRNLEAVVTSGDTEYTGNVTIPETVTYNDMTFNVIYINTYTFQDCTSLTSVTIPNSVKEIGSLAFNGCTSLTSVTIPNSVISIWTKTFQNCTSLASIEIPNSVTSIRENAFSGCTSLASIEIPNSVKEIRSSAFENCTSLASVTIPNSVTVIGSGAFQGCSSLTSIVIPNSVTSIGEYIFCGCSDLTDVSVDKGNTVYDSRENCNAIINSATNTLIAGCKNTVIPNSVTSISTYAFYGCSSLISIEIPNSVMSIGEYAFQNCTSLISVTIPNSVTSIGIFAFASCSSLASIEIPNSITCIERSLFRGCTSLALVTIPKSVTEIRSYAFAGCTGLTDVYCYAEDVPAKHYYAFDSSPISSATLHVPAVYVERYVNPWKFGSIVPITAPKHTLTYMVDGEVYKTYSVEENEEIIPEPEPEREGFTFSGWSEIPKTMPANDVEVTGSFTVNSYNVTFQYGDVVLTTTKVEYGAVIPLPKSLDSDRYILIEWLDVPATMPAHDIIIYADFIDGIKAIRGNSLDVEHYQLNGIRRNVLYRGINILRINDGTTKKVLMR